MKSLLLNSLFFEQTLRSRLDIYKCWGPNAASRVTGTNAQINHNAWAEFLSSPYQMPALTTDGSSHVHVEEIESVKIGCSASTGSVKFRRQRFVINFTVSLEEDVPSTHHRIPRTACQSRRAPVSPVGWKQTKATTHSQESHTSPVRKLH